MQPGGESRVAAKGSDLAMELKEGLLGEIFGFGNVADHAQTQGINASLVEGVKMGKGVVVAGLGAGKHFCIGRERGGGGRLGVQDR